MHYCPIIGNGGGQERDRGEHIKTLKEVKKEKEAKAEEM